MQLLILYIVLTIGLSFLCSLLEATILSVTSAYINVISQSRPRSGKLLFRLKSNIDKSLSAILTLNTFANTLGAAGIGTMAGKLFDSEVAAIISFGLALAILIFSEIVPKTLGAVYWRKVAPWAAYIIAGMMFVLGPIVFMTRLISRMINPSGNGHNIVSREEIQAVADMGHDHGALHQQENKIIQNLLCLQTIRANDILTPRSVVYAFQQDKTIADVIRDNKQVPFSRIPIYNDDLDDITGFVLRYRMAQEYNSGRGHLTLKEIAREIHAIPDIANVANVLNELITRREHIFLVVDEYGGTAGIVTMEDVIETLLGVEIFDENQPVSDMRMHAKRLWEKRQQDLKMIEKTISKGECDGK
ncbi:MAG: HlyC/CorC family transporter [Sedimentisphaerales bacterium]|nr:HlyC/CorC family transporter [Sedimentisphaerales bacterium]